MDERVNTLNQMLGVLSREQDRVWIRQGPGASDWARKTYQLLCSSLQSVNQKEIETWLTSDEKIDMDFASHNKFLYLPPLERKANFVPILQMQCTLKEDQMDVKLRVMFLRSIDDENRIGGLGFRLERGKDRHSFYHAQFIHDFAAIRDSRSIDIESLDWLPEGQPSFPLAAKCPITLMLCLLLSLYGKEYCGTFVNDHQIFKLQSYLNEIDNWYNG